MNLPSNYTGKLSAICSSEPWDTRTAAPYLDVEASVLVGTNGSAMCVLPVTVDAGEKSGIVPREALRRFIGGSKRKAKLFCGDMCQLAFEDGETASFPRREITYPNYSSALECRSGFPTLILNPSLLKSLADAMGAGESVALWVKSPTDPVVVACGLGRKTGHIGVLMPMRGHDEFCSSPELPKAISERRAAAAAVKEAQVA